MKKIVIVDKQREYWNCGDFEVAVDDVKGLGYFVEVEAKSNFENAIQARQKCIIFLDKLGMTVNEEDLIKVGYPVMLINNKS
ncbi:MAG: CYTH domain-containing protein [bacterium]